MKLVHGTKYYIPQRKSVLTLGNFDGVHIGHKHILKLLTKEAEQRGEVSIVYTFEPHPAKLLAPQTELKLIQTYSQKYQTLEQLGVDICIVENFRTELAAMEADTFFSEVVMKLAPSTIVIGSDFTFGYKRGGDIVTLRRFCDAKNIDLNIVPPVFFDDILVSSTQIRNSIKAGRAVLANNLLGRPYSITGKVIKGHGRGRKLGIHTANIATENELLPKKGVYITKTILESKCHQSITSVGTCPTFGGKEISIETHIIDFAESIYGKQIEIQFIKFQRDEKTFPNSTSLAEQIKKDIQEAKYFYEAEK